MADTTSPDNSLPYSPAAGKEQADSLPYSDSFLEVGGNEASALRAFAFRIF